MDLMPYPAMKDSGVAWLGEVPEHWEVRRLGQMGRLSKGNGGSKEDEVPTGVPCVRYGDLYTTHTYFILKSRSFVSPAKAESYTPIARGDVLFAASGETIDEIGKSAVNLMRSEACCGGDVIVFRPGREVEARYMGYATDCRPAAAQKATMGRGITIKHIYGDQLKYLTLALPPLPEQAAIARFLNHADRQIRRYIRTKQKLIKLLEEQKQAIIHCAVTRGLDPSVRLNPSGVEALGEVPEKWEVRPAKYFYREVDERSSRGEEELLSVSHITGVTPRSLKSITMFMALSYAGHKLCRPGDLVINTMWAWMGALGVAKHTGIVSPSYGVYRPARNSKLLGDYADLLLRTKPFVAEYTRRSTGIRSSRLRLYPEQFLRVNLVCPSIEDQKAILDCVASATTAIRLAMASTFREINLLREHRTRLIADVVTGKLDVREAAATLPDEADEAEPLDDTAAVDADEVADDAELDAAPEEDEA